MKCPICNGKEDTTEHVLECETAETVYRIKGNTPNQWAKVRAEKFGARSYCAPYIHQISF